MEAPLYLGNATTAPAASQTPMITTILESSIPGLSILTRFLKDYLNIDISQYFGLLLVLVGLGTAFNYCYDRMFGFYSDYFCSTAEIRHNDEIFDYVMFFIAKNGMSRGTRKFVAATQQSYHRGYDSDAEDEFEMDDDELNDENLKQIRNWDRVKALKFTPSSGTHYFRYKGHMITFTRTQDTEKGYWGSSLREDLYLSCFGRNTQVLKDLLHDAQLAYLERDGNKTIIYRGSRPYGGSSDSLEWVRCMSRSPRPMSTVVLDERQKELILNDMRDYLHPKTKRWYSSRGLPYRRGFLLNGPPGTGKSSLCFALAGVLHLRIYVVSLNSKSMSEDTLSSLFGELPARCIVLLEDIDSAGLTMRGRIEEPNEDKDEKVEPSTAVAGPTNLDATTTGNKGISLSGFLNIIDGVASSEGRILVMTTNHIENLDPALLRPGRCDLIVNFSYATPAMIRGLFLAIYSDTTSDDRTNNVVNKDSAVASGEVRKRALPAHGKTESEISDLADKFASILPADKYTPAEIQGFLLMHKHDPAGSLDKLPEWIVEHEKNKNNQKS